MHRLLILFSWFALVRGLALPQPEGRITGGEVINVTQVPYQISIEWILETEYHWCDASIIGDDWAVTTADCVAGKELSALQIRSGSSNILSEGEIHQVKAVLIHPQWDKISYDYNVALMQVSQPFKMDETRQPIKISDVIPGESVIGIVSGWGLTDVDHNNHWVSMMQRAPLPIVAHDPCQDTYNFYQLTITDRMICAGGDGRGACKSDKGGPFVVDEALLGLVSWPVDCSWSLIPAVFTNVANIDIRNWIREQTNI